MTQRVAMIDLATEKKRGGVESYVIELSKKLHLHSAYCLTRYDHGIPLSEQWGNYSGGDVLALSGQCNKIA
jgi:hypothetical protein